MMKYILIAAVLLGSRVSFAQPNPAAAPSASPSEAKAVQLVQHALVVPLARKERSRSHFTRASLPPKQRRVRALDVRPLRDAHGDAFVRFAIDERHGLGQAKWNQGAITGCVYLGRGKVFVKKGDGFRPAEFLLGKYRKAAGSAICHPAHGLARSGR